MSEFENIILCVSRIAAGVHRTEYTPERFNELALLGGSRVVCECVCVFEEGRPQGFAGFCGRSEIETVGGVWPCACDGAALWALLWMVDAEKPQKPDEMQFQSYMCVLVYCWVLVDRERVSCVFFYIHISCAKSRCGECTRVRLIRM